MAGLAERRLRTESKPRFDFAITDKWLAKTVHGAFHTVGLKSPQLIDQPGREYPYISAAVDSSPMIHLDGKLIHIKGDKKDALMFKKTLLTASAYKRRNASESTGSVRVKSKEELVESLERGIEFAVAVHKAVSMGHDLQTAFVAFGKQEKENYNKDGVFGDKAENGVYDQIKFAASVFISLVDHNEDLSKIGKKNEEDRIRSQVRASQRIIFEEQEPITPKAV